LGVCQIGHPLQERRLALIVFRISLRKTAKINALLDLLGSPERVSAACKHVKELVTEVTVGQLSSDGLLELREDRAGTGKVFNRNLSDNVLVAKLAVQSLICWLGYIEHELSVVSDANCRSDVEFERLIKLICVELLLDMSTLLLSTNLR